ncbi:MAG: hypothetical protein J6R86_01395 [Lentisphaeria bacterium]|nr:hypothetical protein [Lentisphaeria bacterium]
MSFWITIAVLLVSPAIFLLIPLLRKRNGNFLIIFKTIPLGIIAGFFAHKAIVRLCRMYSEYKMDNIQAPTWLNIAITLAAALGVTIGSGIFFRKIFKAEGKYNPLPSIIGFFISLPAVAILTVMIDMATWGAQINNYEDNEYHSLFFPLDGIKLSFDSQSIHPFLAEYNYRLRIIKGDKPHSFQLFMNTGGRTHFNIYRLSNGQYLFREKLWDYLVDTAKPQVYTLRKKEDKLFAAAMPDGNINYGSGVFKKKGQYVIYIGDHLVPAEDVTGILDNMEYAGCIKDRFYSPGEQPESSIDHFYPR